MISIGLLGQLIFGRPPPLPDMVTEDYELLFDEGLTMGTLYIGRQGTGKTSSLARHIVEYFKIYPNRGIFVLDWSGSISDSILTLIQQEPKEMREKLIKRLVYDELGHPDWVIPLPEFSPAYGSSYEEQAQRVSTNLVKLAPELVTGAPYLAGLGIREIAPQIFRLLAAVENEHGESYQITEAKKMLVDPNWLKNAINNYGDKVPEAKWFLQRVFSKFNPREKDLRTFAILALLGTIEPREARARVGYYKPGWTPKEAIENGLIILVDGSRLINQRNTQHYLFTQAYSLIMAEINKRQPGNPKDKPVTLVMDEVYSLLSIPGMAEEIGMLSPLYRSRKLELYVVLQALSQLAPELERQIWSIGNIICFGVSNFDEAYDLAQQLFRYEPKTEKATPKSEVQHAVYEPDRGQYLKIANYIQRMKHRECIMRRYENEKVLDRYVRYVPQTREYPTNELEESVAVLKERLLKERGVPVKDALDEINQRSLTNSGAKKVPNKIPNS